VIKTVTHEEVTKEALGGAHTHNERSGVAHFACPSEAAAMALSRELLSYLPSNNAEDPPNRPTKDDPRRSCPELIDAIPEDPSRPYDIRAVIRSIADDGAFLEVQELFARNIVIGFARIAGRASASSRTSRWCWRAASTSTRR
jgi:propionyl-CoA carboxylase beta chain